MRRWGWRAVIVTLVGLAACGGGGAGTSVERFTEQIDDTCRALDRELGTLDPPAAVDALAEYAADASKAFEEALADLKKLALPSGSTGLVSDAKQLLANLDDQIDALDDIASAARKGDATAAQARVVDFDALTADNSELAGSLDTPRCDLDPLFAAVVPPVTQPPPTQPPATEPPVTQPPVTQPPATEPVGSTKRPESLLSNLSPAGNYSFVDLDPALVDTFTLLLDVTPILTPQAGVVGGVEVLDDGGSNFARIFVFVADQPLTAGSIEQLIPTLAGDNFQQPATFGGLTGVLYQSSEGGFFFIATDSVTATNVILWVVAQSEDALDVAVSAFRDSLV